ncbi:MAG: 16S rRNA (adenine(1518)-N(6)/adenine(1519)-N(6))-dimethyltransferase RsmA [Treponema sp.]|jgi:16S rRNA (adenine1518-N6/adenine1519-N6)-dimethyltransferase|nr:16S rRNA (adenine(1518)-N(6)/adenine(1519)-N(6))-dimethyltransferase RsmA [Treponema sp.]
MPPLNYDSPQSLHAFLDSRGLGIRKKFGQNFLINQDARRKLVDALEICEGSVVWEVGAGLGAMTNLLLERGAIVNAFEIDAGFIAVLQEFFGGNPRFNLIKGDALKTWRLQPAQLAAADFFLGNLPYTIAATLLADFIEKNRFFKRIVATVQKEVAARIIARPKSKNYSSFSVLCASAYTMTPLMTLKGASFYPAPHVDSQAVRFDIRTDIDPVAAYPPLFRPLVRGLFASRRKTVKNNLTAFASSRFRGNRCGVDGVINSANASNNASAIAVEALRLCGIPENERAEHLEIHDFVNMAEKLARLLEGAGA